MFHYLFNYLKNNFETKRRVKSRKFIHEMHPNNLTKTIADFYPTLIQDWQIKGIKIDILILL